MFISTTKTLVKRIGAEYKEAPAYNRVSPDFYWHMALKKHENKQYIFLINEMSRFLIVLENPDTNRLTEEIKEAMIKSFENAGFSTEIIKNYMDQAGEFSYGENRNKTMASWLNKEAKDAFERIDYYNQSDYTYSLSEIGPEVSILPVRTGYKKKGPFIPRVAALRMLQKVDKMPLRVYPHILEIKSTLVGSILKTERTFLIEGNTTFSELSYILMNLYGFDGFHLYAFEIFDSKRKYDPNYRAFGPGADPGDHWLLGFDTGKNIDFDRPVNSFFDSADHIIFNYDFGDNWEIKLVLKNKFAGSEDDSFLPYLLSSKGPSPIEDIGGIWTYNELVYAFKYPDEIDPENARLQDILEWVDETDFDVDAKLEIPHKI